MDWFFPKNDESSGVKVIITPVSARDSETRRDVNSVELRIGNEDDMLRDCQRLVVTKKEWASLKRKINKSI